MLHSNNSTNKRGSDEDDFGAHAGFVDLSSILGRLQHLDIVQVHPRDIQTLCSKRQIMTLLLQNVYDLLVHGIKKGNFLEILFTTLGSFFG